MVISLKYDGETMWKQIVCWTKAIYLKRSGGSWDVRSCRELGAENLGKNWSLWWFYWD